MIHEPDAYHAANSIFAKLPFCAEIIFSSRFALVSPCNLIKPATLIKICMEMKSGCCCLLFVVNQSGCVIFFEWKCPRLFVKRPKTEELQIMRSVRAIISISGSIARYFGYCLTFSVWSHFFRSFEYLNVTAVNES